MAKACGLELSQNNSDEGIRPNSKDASFSLLVVNNSIQILEDENKKLKEENEMLRRLVGRD